MPFHKLEFAIVAMLLWAAVPTSAQEFHFGTDIVDGQETGRIGGGYATGIIDFMLDGSQLTAVLRNTSPDVENYGGNNELGSPAARRFDFDLASVTGEKLQLVSWELTALDETGSSVVLGNDSGGGIDKWRMMNKGKGAFRVKSRGGKSPKGPLYNSAAGGGFGAAANYFTDAVLVATFNASIGSADLNPEIRFENLGTNRKSKTLRGVSASANPEPGSLLVWSGLIAAIGWRTGRRRTRLCR